MTATSSYTIEQLIGDVRNVFATTRDPRKQAEAIAEPLELLLNAPDLVEDIERRAAGRTGRIDLHIDQQYGHPGPGFCVMTSIPNPEARNPQGERLPHDHGASWVAYGVFKGATEQVKYRWSYPGEGRWTSPELKECERFVQQAGQVAFFLPGEIHQTSRVGSEPSRIIRIEAQYLDRVTRHVYNPKTRTTSLVKA
jgi:hypothetical protein